MATCQRGHPSADEEYCDVCGALIARDGDKDSLPVPAARLRELRAAAAGQEPAQGPQAPEDADAERCPVCDNPRVAQFCEQCGYDFVAGAAPGDGATGYTTRRAPERCPVCDNVRVANVCERCGYDFETHATQRAPRWVAVIGTDRAYFDKVIAEGGPDAGGVAFPPYNPQRHVRLTGGEVRIGRRSRSRPVSPEIDLGEPPKDPGVSHLHAVLLAQPDGRWTLVDPGSANGTLVNGTPVETNVPVPLGSGDRIHLGAWTFITLCERDVIGITLCERDVIGGGPGEGGTP